MRWSRFPAWKLTVGYPRILRKSVLRIVDMLYTWDEEKRKANRAKHGVDLADAALIFEDFCLIREDVTEGYAEQRFLAIGRTGGHILMVGLYPARRGHDTYYLGPAGRQTGTTKILP
jgi:uncharacterized DUF497 family protein